MRFILYIFLFQFSFLSITTAQLSLMAENQTATSGSTISVPIYITPDQANDILGLQFTINWDDNLLDYQSVSNFGISSLNIENFGTPQVTTFNNTLILIWEDYPNTFSITENTLLFNINFSVNPNFTSGTTDVRFCSDCTMELLDENLTEFNVAYQNGQVTFSSLPIELLQFDAQIQDKKAVQLTWSTATENNNSHFEIEHSTDAKTWQTLEKIAGIGTSTIEQNYQYLDTKPVTGENFYRLKQVDVNGAFKYSTTQTVIIEKGTGLVSWINPVQDELHFTYETIQETAIKFEIYSVDGKLITAKNFNLLSGQNNLEWDIHHLPNGTYWVKQLANETAVFKIVKQ